MVSNVARMRIALALVASLVAAPALADDAAPGAPPSQTAPTTSAPPAPEQPVDESYSETLVPTPPRHVDDIVVKSRPDRPRTTVIALAAGVGAGVILGGVGLYYHLDSRDASQELTSHTLTGDAWTADKQATYDRAHDSGRTAAVFYGIGGAVLVGTVVALILTEPKEETTIIHPHTALVAPTQGGAIVGGTWSF